MLAVVHYGEIGTKGDNRLFFEKLLAENIEKQAGMRVARRYGRLLAEGESIEKLADVFGVSYYAAAEKTPLDIGAIKEKALELAQRSSATTFRIAASRSNKSFPLDSMQINKEVGAHVAASGKKADLSKPELTIFIEITEKEALLYTEKQRGPGGLPVGCAGRVIALLSGGIDSPVAALLAAKRGCVPVLVHFHNYADARMTGKVEHIAEKLARLAPGTKLYIVPFLFVQEEIIKAVPDTHRMVVYRRVMLRIAERIAQREGAKAFVTGDSIGQVASQTLDNLAAIYGAAQLPVLAPLLGYDKQEIIDAAKRIGTYDDSVLPYQDCCSFMVAEHPATSAKPGEVERMEANLNGALLGEAVSRAEVRAF